MFVKQTGLKAHEQVIGRNRLLNEVSVCGASVQTQLMTMQLPMNLSPDDSSEQQQSMPVYELDE